MTIRTADDYVAEKIDSLGLASLGADSGWSVVTNEVPDKPDHVVIVILGDDSQANNKFAMDQDDILIAVRGEATNAGEKAAKEKALEIMNKVAGNSPETWEDYRITGVTIELGVGKMDIEDEGRPLFRFVLKVWREYTEAADTNRTIL